MSNWMCGGCRAVYTVRLFTCPRCHSTDEGTYVVAKSTVNNGASDASATPPEDNSAPSEESTADAPVETVEQEEVESDEQVKADLTERYSALTVADLKDELYELGLPVTGNKAELVDRLVEYRLAPRSHEAHAGVAEAKGTANG